MILMSPTPFTSSPRLGPSPSMETPDLNTFLAPFTASEELALVFCSIYTTIFDHSNLVLDNLLVIGTASVESRAWSRGRLGQRVKPMPFDLGIGVLDPQTKCKSTE